MTFPRISRQLAHEGDKIDRNNHRPPLPQGDIPSNYFCCRVSRTQGHIANSLAGEPATLGVVAQCFDHCATAYAYGGAEGEINLSWRYKYRITEVGVRVRDQQLPSFHAERYDNEFRKSFVFDCQMGQLSVSCHPKGFALYSSALQNS